METFEETPTPPDAEAAERAGRAVALAAVQREVAGCTRCVAARFIKAALS